MDWSYRFEADGGYDCMTDAYEIYHKNQLVAIIDLAFLGQTACGDNSTAKRIAQAYAEQIVGAMNALRPQE